MPHTQNQEATEASTHLTHHDGEGENPHKVVDELKYDFKEVGGVRQAADGDQALHRKVVTADVAAERPSGSDRERNRAHVADWRRVGGANLLPLPL